MATTLAKLQVQLEAESSRLTSELEKVNKKMSRWERKTSSVVNKVKGTFLSLGAGLVAGLGVAKISADFRKLTDEVDKMGKLSQRLNIGVGALSELRHAADLSGVSFETLSMSLQRLGRRTSQAATGTGEAKNALAELGLSAEEINKLELDQQFELVAEAMSRLENQNDKTRIAQDLMGRSGADLLQIMVNGAKGIRDMRQEARDLGITLDEDLAQKSADVNDAFTRLSAVSKATGLTILRVLSPVVTNVVNWLTVNIPSAINVAITAFNKLRELVQQFKVLDAAVTSTANRFAASIADFIGADETAEAHRKLADSWDEYGRAAAATLLDIREASSDTTAAMASELQLSVDFKQFYQQALRDNRLAEIQSKGSKAGLAKAQKEINKGLQEAARIAESTLTPLEKNQKLVMKLNDLRSQFPDVITDEVYTRALREYNKELDVATGKTELFDKLRDVSLKVSPTAGVTRELKEINKLLEDPRTPEIYFDTLTERAFQLQEELEGINNTIGDDTEKMKDLADELGMTFSSAAEDAIVNWKGVGDVLKGLEQDLIRIATRELFTKPLASSFSSAIQSPNITGFVSGLGSMVSGLLGFQNGGQFRIGGSGGPDSQVVSFRGSPDEVVTVTSPGSPTPGGVTVNGPLAQIITPDYNSFRHSDGQVGNIMFNKLQQASRNL